MHRTSTSSPLALPTRAAVGGLLIVALAVACTTVPGGSPSPTSGGSPTPTSQPLPTDQPSPTAPPTQTPIPSPTFSIDQISHPTGPAEVVLQMETGGGFVPMEFAITQAPSFSLYGDGTLIFRPTEDLGPLRPDFGVPAFLQVQLTEEQVQELLRVALGQGRLLDAREHYPQNTCADCPSTIFTINAAEISKTVTVDALGMADEAGPDVVDRRGFAALAQILGSFDQRARNGELGEVVAYDPPMYRVVLTESQAGAGAPGAWPWPDRDIDDFPVDANGFRREAVLSRELVALVTDVPTGGVGSVLVEAANDEIWSIAVRPLLPNEVPVDQPL